MILFQIYFVCLFVLYSKFESTKMHVLYLRKKFKWKLIVFIVCKELIIFFKIDTENHQLMLYFVDYSYLYQHFMQYWYVIESMINCCHSICIFSNCNSCVYELIYEISNNFNHCLRKNKQLSQECSTLFITWISFFINQRRHVTMLKQNKA